ncbi:hypothetical protein Gohar_002661, partial [Gossypium harknessii]|nr:hypothetical protein [Gossypium harknessii]
MFGLLTILAALVLSVRIVLFECHVPNIAYKEVSQKFLDAGKAMWMTLKWLDDSNGCLFLCWLQSFEEALGIEDTFFVLLMSIDNVGLLSSSWERGLLLGDPSSSILPTNMLSSKGETETKAKESNNIELVSLVNSV